MLTNEARPLLYSRKADIFFSISFVIMLPFSVVLFPFLMFLFNIIFFPITLIHELGHYCIIKCLQPSLHPQMEIGLTQGDFQCGCVLTQGFPCCWSSIFSMLGGTVSVAFFVLIIVYTLSKLEYNSIHSIIKKYLIFGLLADIPNLFPIFPSSLGSTTDGYAIYMYLHQMGYVPLFSANFSYLLSWISIFLVCTSFYFLGSFFFQIIFVIVEKIELQRHSLPS